jgi:hypothetical protein
VDIATIQMHLTTTGSSVAFTDGPVPRSPFYKLPGQRDEYKGFRVSLEDGDVDRLFLWWEFGQYTGSGSSKLTDMPASMTPFRKPTLDRVKPFIEGIPGSGNAPVDLLTTANMEIVIVSNDLENGILYIIDGNHRVIARKLTNKGFKDVPAFACVHPKMQEWDMFPPKHKPT